jgi:hypothetical protein
MQNTVAQTKYLEKNGDSEEKGGNQVFLDPQLIGACNQCCGTGTVGTVTFLLAEPEREP